MHHDPQAPGVAARPLIIELLEKRERKSYEFPADGIFGFGGAPLATIRLRALTKREEDEAVKAADDYAKGVAGTNDIIRSDPDLLLDAKNIEAMFRACVDERGNRLFPHPNWMRDHFTTDHLAVLTNLYLDVRRREGPLNWGTDRERLEAIALACAAAEGTDIPESVLAYVPREQLGVVTCGIAGLLAEERRARAVEVEELKQQLAEARTGMPRALPAVESWQVSTGTLTAPAKP